MDSVYQRGLVACLRQYSRSVNRSCFQLPYKTGQLPHWLSLFPCLKKEAEEARTTGVRVLSCWIALIPVCTLCPSQPIAASSPSQKLS